MTTKPAQLTTSDGAPVGDGSGCLTKGKCCPMSMCYSTEPALLTTSFGAPVADESRSLTVGKCGPALMSDTVLMDNLAHFNRERIPERVVHAKGTGAYGIFEVTRDMTNLTKASMFSEIGQKTKVFVRFSTTSPSKGSADTVRDIRGLSAKFYTKEANVDMACISTPAFFVCDAMKFPSLNHAMKPDPKTNLINDSNLWDFMTLNNESALAMMHLYSDDGIPDGYTTLEAYACHAFRLVNAAGEHTYCKFQFTPVEEERFLATDEAIRLAGVDPDYATRDLYCSIKNGNFPQWRLEMQLMTQEQSEAMPCCFTDITREWDEEQHPLMEIGILTLNENPKNHFKEVEQAAFCPGNLCPGIEAAPDKAFDARAFAYADAQRARLGPNFAQLEVNRPIVCVNNYQQDGLMTFDQVGKTNYFPNSTGGPQPNPKYKQTVYKACGDVDRYDCCEDHFSQPRAFYNAMEEDHKNRTAQNFADSISRARPEIQPRALDYLNSIDPDLMERTARLVTEIPECGAP
ncbi:vegetative catalase-like [Bufo bufo]|uniref:vegetative catalase-like n=1 Tax=Bufo bufo TaxID=8384 RepID=UPI001ABDA9D5|nr:vegetative catalase-like [Bufo bufo]